MWSRDDVPVSVPPLPLCLRSITSRYIAIVFWVHHCEGDVPRILSSFRIDQTDEIYKLEFEEHGSAFLVCVQTSKKATFRRICVAILSQHSSDASQEGTVLGQLVEAVELDVPVATLNGGSRVLAEAFATYLGKEYRQIMVKNPTFDLWMFRQCLQWTASRAFGCLDPLWMTECVVHRLMAQKIFTGWPSVLPFRELSSPNTWASSN